LRMVGECSVMGLAIKVTFVGPRKYIGSCDARYLDKSAIRSQSLLLEGIP
jgi:hypothetical protein